MAYIGKSPDGTGVRSRFYYTQSSGGGTSVSGSSDDGTSLAFSDGAYVDVFLNGVLLVAGTDYNTSTANTIAGLAALASGDVVEVVVYDIFTVADTVSSLNGGTFTGAVGFSGGITGDVAFDTNTLVVDAANNRIGIGQSSPNQKLDVNGNIVTDSYSLGAGNGIFLRRGFESTAQPSITVADHSGSAPDGLSVNGNDGVSFRTSDTERMRIDQSGLLCIARTSGGGRVNVQAHTNNFFIELYNQSGSSVGSITTNGSSTAYNTTSDHRLKEAVVDMTGAIARVKQLAPKRFNFIADPDDTTVDGFLAHEAQTVVPEAVTGEHNEVDDDGNAVMQGIDQSKLVPLLTGALKEAIAKIETLETKVAALENAE